MCRSPPAVPATLKCARVAAVLCTLIYSAFLHVAKASECVWSRALIATTPTGASRPSWDWFERHADGTPAKHSESPVSYQSLHVHQLFPSRCPRSSRSGLALRRHGFFTNVCQAGEGACVASSLLLRGCTSSAILRLLETRPSFAIASGRVAEIWKLWARTANKRNGTASMSAIWAVSIRGPII